MPAVASDQGKTVPLSFSERLLYAAVGSGDIALVDELAPIVENDPRSPDRWALAHRLRAIRERGPLEPARLCGLSRVQATLLSELLIRGPMTVNELEPEMARASAGAHFIDFSRSGIRRALYILERRGLAERRREPRHGNRAWTRWCLTDAGDQALGRYLDAAEALPNG